MSGFVGPTCNMLQNQCDFEDPYICYFVQDKYDDFDWIRRSGSTPSFRTGPEYDHTYGTSQGFYMYIETSPQNLNDTARLWTTSYPATNGTCVEWFYHMYGATVNILSVYIVNTAGTFGKPVWTIRNDQGNVWRLGKIFVETKSAYQIVFEGIVGSSYTSDIALDDVKITDGICLRNETCDIDCLNGGVCVISEYYGIENCQCMSGFFGPTCNITQTKCDFEDPYICYFDQDKLDDFDWIRTSGSTPTSGTGPSYDHTYGTLEGSYMYIETSYPRYNNETARLWTPSYPATNGTCVKWFYHMYGDTVNTLNVYIVNTEGNVGAPAWGNSNDQGNIWRLGKLSVETKSAFQIVFEGIVGSSDKGDIALDDVRIIDGACLRNETCDIDCLNGGVCVSAYGIENCQCMSGFVGPTCNMSQNQCDFEDPYICYFVQDELDDFDWIRTSGSTPSHGTGPEYDHTYGTLQGFYIYIETSVQNLNDIARIWTTSYPATDGTCVQWYYHMYGATVNTLNVYIVNTTSTVGTIAWTNKNDQGNFWRLGQISIELNNAFQIMFEGIVGSSSTGDIALDDVTITDGICSRNETCDIDCLNGGVCVISDYGIKKCQCLSNFVGPTCNIIQNQCNFEDPYICYFVQDEYDDFDWIRRAGSTPSFRTGPEYDHTYGTSQGFYMYIETSPQNLNDIARLWTTSYPATNGTCVEWFYHMYGATVNTLSVYIVNTAGTVGKPVWTIRNDQGNVWRLGKIFVETNSAYQIVFEGIVGSSYTSDIALDDVKITDGICLRNETCNIECFNGGVCVISDYGIENCQCLSGFFGPTCNITQTQCDFEDQYICYFVQDKTDDFDWIRTSGSTPSSRTGPKYDHTYGTSQGFYMYIETSNPRNYNETARIWTPSYPATNGTCVEWFYHMYGTTVNILNVYIVNTAGTVGIPAWTESNDQGNIWRLGQIPVETNSTYKIVFEGIVGSSHTGDIALDDVRFTDGACLRDAQTKCDFEDPYICYFNQDELDDFDWIRTSGPTPTSGTGPSYDHTYGTLQGSYMYIETSYPQYNNETARLWTPSYPATNGTCVKWFYHMYGATVNTLNVYIVNTDGTIGAPSWGNRNDQGNIWRLGKISVETKSAFQIVFEGIVGGSDKGDIALDDVRIIDGACSRNEICDIYCLNGGVCVSNYGIENCQCMSGFFGPTCNISQTQCGFEDPHICYFVQDKSDDFDWIRTSGSTPSSRTGPDYDHTYGTLQGFYMYIETSNPRNYNQTARIWTPSYPATNGTCVEWFYHMYGATVNTLNVYIINTGGTVGTPVWTKRDDQGNLWRLGQISVKTTSAYEIVFEGIVGSSYSGDIALDDFKITDGACLINETSTTYVHLTDSTVNPVTVPQTMSFPQDLDDSTTDIFDVTNTSPSRSTSANYGNSNVFNISPTPSTSNTGTDNFKTSPLKSSSSATDYADSTNQTSIVNAKPTVEIETSTKHQKETSYSYTEVMLTKTDGEVTTVITGKTFTELRVQPSVTPMKTTIPDDRETTAIRHHKTSGISSAQVNSSPTQYKEGSNRSKEYTSQTAPQSNTGLEHLSNATEPVSVTKTEAGSTISNTQAVNYQEAISLTLQGQEEQWISAKQTFRASISKAVNSFCHSNARKCCSLTDFNEQDTLDGDVTTTENVNLNERISENQIVIILSIKYNNYIETCSQNDEDRARRDAINQYNNLFRQIVRRNTNEYISADVVKSSIEEGKENIEAEIRMDIVDVSVYNTDDKNEDDGYNSKSYTVFIVVGACLAGMGMLVFGVFIYKMNKKKIKRTMIEVIPLKTNSLDTEQLINC
ncbi:MAM and LDL-receptor class A domain-containing protein 1-like isoform X2 [Anneissia japonica]|uniref:MAM and LDL-receptor class A domain-containing protein 1-like isoform X2 n=1 Tax=Anneissia japonica TaxID=1529436 RepID=UPI001425B824|nr:MAM and LDL-receptor class A domain-containing protein 1-like isoform X2 [Anneissia japonica]